MFSLGNVRNLRSFTSAFSNTCAAERMRRRSPHLIAQPVPGCSPSPLFPVKRFVPSTRMLLTIATVWADSWIRQAFELWSSITVRIHLYSDYNNHEHTTLYLN